MEGKKCIEKNRVVSWWWGRRVYVINDGVQMQTGPRVDLGVVFTAVSWFHRFAQLASEAIVLFLLLMLMAS